MNNLYFQPLIRLCFVIFIVGLLLLFHYLAIVYLYPFIIASVISAFLQPFISYLERTWRIHRTLASYLVILSSSSFILLLTLLLFQRLGKELAHIIEKLPTIFTTMNHWFIEFGQTIFLPFYDTLQSKLFFLPKIDTWRIEETIPFLTKELYESSYLIVTNLFSSVTIMITYVSQTGIMILFIVISIIIMTKDYMLITRYARQFIPIQLSKKGLEIISQLKKSTFGLMKAHFFLALLSSIIVLIALLFMRVENILVLTIIIFIVDLIPYIGIGLVFIPWIVYQFFNGDYLLTIELTSLYMFIVIIRQFLEPRVIATHLGIHPLIALILLFISMQQFGVIGIFITPIMLIILSAIYHVNLFPIILNFILDKK